jgi:hypothetical protein
MPVLPPSTPSRKVPMKLFIALIAASAVIGAALIKTYRISPPSPPTPLPTSVITAPLSPGQAQQQYLNIVNTQSPTLTDSLTVQNSNAWDALSSSNSSSGCEFKGGGYHSFMSKPNVVECLAKGSSLGNNFVYQVRITTQQGDGGGIIFGSSASNGSIKYRFYVNTASYCDVFSPTGGRLFSDSKCPISSSSTLVAAMVISNTIYLFINKKYVGYFHTTDGGPLSGQFGVFGEEVNTPTDVFFDQLSVWQMAG